MIYLILIGCLILVGVSGQIPKPMSDDGMQYDFSIFKKEYQTIVEVNDETQKYSMIEEEYYDPGKKRSAVFQFADKKHTRVLQYKDFKQVLFISDDAHNCSVCNISSIKDAYPFGERNLNNNRFVYRSTNLINSGYNAKDCDKGPNTIRGIKVNSCNRKIDWEGRKFSLTTHFAVNEWKDTGSISSGIPVRITLEETGSKSKTSLHHTYDYHFFSDSIEDISDAVFESPKGIVCKDRKFNMSLPDLVPIFSTGIELRFENTIKMIDVSYNKPDQLLRIDYQPGGIESSAYPEIVNTLSEIYDYNTGIGYLRDLVYGNCSAIKLRNSSFEDKTTMSFEGYIVKNVMGMFKQKKDFEYVGLRTVRNIKCLVFAAHSKTFKDQSGSLSPSTYEIYLSSTDWTILPDKSGTLYSIYPLRVNILSDEDGLSYEMNFIDFVASQTDLSTFDISSCYGTSTKMHISILLSGNYMKSTKEIVEETGKSLMKQFMNLNILQIQDVKISYDTNIMYLYASILDRTPPESQFTLKSTNYKRMSGDKVFQQVSNYKDCAEKCVHYKECKGFEICGADCIVSKNDFNSGQTVSDSSSYCYHYSRSILNQEVKDISLELAYKQLQNAIAQGLFVFTVNAGNVESEYIGLYVRVDAGKLLKTSLQKLEDNFQYHAEIVLPKDQSSEEIKVFYDENKNLVRFDVNKDICQGLCNGPSKIVQDFTGGIIYVMNKITGTCQIQPFVNTFATDSNNKMKTSAQIFFLDNSYTYVGQQHVRGMLTNIFEGHVAQWNDDLFRYYFLDENWNGSPVISNCICLQENWNGSQMVPVRVEISSNVDNDPLYRTDNYFEFLDDILMSTFDVSSCYREINKITDLQITFKGSYKQQAENFIFATVKKIMEFTHLPEMNFQNPEISFNEEKTYFRVSLIDPKPLAIGLFSISTGFSATSKMSETKLNIESPNDCATLCLKKNYKAFTYSEKRKACQLFPEFPAEYTSNENSNLYKKTKQAKESVLSTKQVLNNLESLIHTGTFKIAFTVVKELEFTALSMLTDIDRSDSKEISSVQNMKSFTKLDKSGTLKSNGPIYKKVSVEECANLCTKSQILNCEAFTYCYFSDICFLSDIHPNATNVHEVDACDIYQRNYINMFDHIPGKTFPMKGEILPVTAQSADICAKSCSDNGIKSCQSFEYCPLNKICTLSSKHVLDIPSTDIITTETCDLYTISSLQHFVQSTKKKVKFNSDLLVQNISLKACARLCMADEGFSCGSFNYCPGNSMCQITGPQQKGINVEANIEAVCSHYIRLDPAPPVVPKTSTVKSGNKGKLIALGFGTFLIGCLLGLLTILFIHKKASAQKDDPMTVNFYKMDEQ